jgi:hypothetical protein
MIAQEFHIYEISAFIWYRRKTAATTIDQWCDRPLERS